MPHLFAYGTLQQEAVQLSTFGFIIPAIFLAVAAFVLNVALARALALNPKILFLDDFTARVDQRTEQKILANIADNYPQLTLVSITQKIAPVMDYDQIILLMEGEILAAGTHDELMHNSPEYVQIYNSQRSTSSYEIRS